MKSTKKTSSSEASIMERPAMTPEAREQQMISLAINLAEEQLRNGTASSQVITHYLKLGSTRERLEKEKIKSEKQLLEAKVEALDSVKSLEGVYKEALEAFKSYRGSDDPI